jgi:hypothetical protein
MSESTGKYLIVFGVLVAIAGTIIYFFHDKLHWVGRLPGDIRINRENFRVYVPITTMIVFSLMLTLLINLIRKLL